MAPPALIGRVTGEATGLAVARLQWMAMGAASSVLVARILKPAGRAAAIFGGLFYAFNYPAV